MVRQASARLAPKSALAFNNRGNVWDDEKNFDKAIADYDEAIRINPHYALAFMNRGIAETGKNEFDHAIQLQTFEVKVEGGEVKVAI